MFKFIEQSERIRKREEAAKRSRMEIEMKAAAAKKSLDDAGVLLMADS